MILAAGQGTRMRPLTYALPKPMIPVLGKPVMEYLVEHLARHGFDQIMVNVSHLPLSIENYFGNGQRFGANIGYSFEGRIDSDGQVISEALGSAGGIKRVHGFGGFFDDTFLVVCGDVITDLDLTTALRRHWQSGAKASVVVQQVAAELLPEYGVVVCGDDGRVTSFQEKPSLDEAKSSLINTGIYIFEPEILEHIPSDTVYDIGSQLLPDLVAGKVPFHAIDMPFHWLDIGRLNDYWEVNQRLMRGEMEQIRMPGREVAPRVWVGLNTAVDWDDCLIEGPVYIGANSRIEAGSEIIGPTWISHGCHLEKSAKVHRSLLFEYTLLRGPSLLSEAVVFGKHRVDRDGTPIENHFPDLDWVGDTRSPPS